MSVTITVALAGDPSDWLAGLRHPEDFDLPYSERPKVIIEADEGEPYGNVLVRAAQAFDIKAVEGDWGTSEFSGPTFIGFFHGDEHEGIKSFGHEVALLDADGHIRWTWEWQAEAVAEYLRAGDAGVLDGDPRRPYLITQPPIGNGVVPTFHAFIELLPYVWIALDFASRVEGAAGLWDRFKSAYRERGKDAEKVIESHFPQWEANNGRPDNLAALLGSRPWHPADLADVLDCTEGEAEAMLIGFGHERNTAGLWVPGESEGAKLVRDNIDFIMHAGMTVRTDAVEQVIKERSEEFARTGEAPQLDWAKLSELPHDLSRLPGYEPPPDETLTEDDEVVRRYSLSSLLHRFRRRRG